MKRNSFEGTEPDWALPGYIVDTNVLSPLLDPTRAQHADVKAAIRALASRSTTFVSAITVAELGFGVQLAEAATGAALPELRRKLTKAHEYAVLDVTRHTAAAYAELKANVASKYLAKALRKDRPRWVEDWIDRATGKRLDVDENDLWICAQAKERNVIVVTADGGMRRIANADVEVRLQIV